MKDLAEIPIIDISKPKHYDPPAPGWMIFGMTLIIFLVAFLPRTLALNTFLTADEDDQLQFSARFLEAVSRRDWAGALVIGYPGVPTMSLGAFGIWLQRYLDTVQPRELLNAVSSIFEGAEISAEYTIFLPMLTKAGNEISPVTLPNAVIQAPLDYIVAVRLPLVLLYAVVSVIIFWGLCQLIDIRLAFIASLLFIFDPFIMAHSRVIHVDAPLAHFMFAAFIGFLVYLQQGRWPWLIFSGVAGALGVLSKTPGIILAPILVTSGFLYIGFAPSKAERSRRIKRLSGALAVWGLVAAVAFVALWPSMWARPGYAVQYIVNNIFSVLAYESHPSSGVFWGPTRADRNPLYYLITIPFHLTPLSTIGLLAGLGGIGMNIVRYRGQRQAPLTKYLPLLLSLLTFIILFITPVSFVGRRADQYILPVYFALDILAAIGLWAIALGGYKLWRAIQQQAYWRPNYLFACVLAAVLIQVGFISTYHPYYYQYYNPLFGGAATAPYLINVGWGEGLNLAARYLNEKPQVRQLRVAAWYSWQFAHYFLGNTIDLASNVPAYYTDYTVFYINQVQRGFPSRELLDYYADRIPEKVIHLNGIDYAWIYPGPIIGTQAPVEVTFPADISFRLPVRLIGLDLPSPQRHDEIPITLFWRVSGSLPENLNVSLRVADRHGLTWGQVDRLPIGGLVRPNHWRAGQIIRDEYRLFLDPAIPPGMYQFNIVLYDFETHEIFGQITQFGQIEVSPAQTPVDLAAYKAALPFTLEASLFADLTLLGYDLMPSTLRPGQKQMIKLHWQAERSLARDYQITIVARDHSGQDYELVTRLIGPTDYHTSRWDAARVLAEVYTFAFPLNAPPGEYTLWVHGDEDQAVSLGQVTLRTQDRLFVLPQGEDGLITPLSAQLGQAIGLAGYQLHHVNGTIDLTLYWAATQTPDNDYTVFVHVVDTAKQIVAQQDAVPANGERPTTTWLSGEFVRDQYQLAVPPGIYTIWLGMYDPLTGIRLDVSADPDLISENRMKLGTIEVSTR